MNSPGVLGEQRIFRQYAPPVLGCGDSRPEIPGIQHVGQTLCDESKAGVCVVARRSELERVPTQPDLVRSMTDDHVRRHLPLPLALNALRASHHLPNSGNGKSEQILASVLACEKGRDHGLETARRGTSQPPRGAQVRLRCVHPHVQSRTLFQPHVGSKRDAAGVDVDPIHLRAVEFAPGWSLIVASEQSDAGCERMVDSRTAGIEARRPAALPRPLRQAGTKTRPVGNRKQI